MSTATYIVAPSMAILLLTSCGGNTLFSSANAAQQNQSGTIKRSTSSCPCLYTLWSRTLAVFGREGTSGNWAQIREISGSNTRLAAPRDVAEDGSGNLYVTNQGGGDSVTVYAAGAMGNVAPIQKIRGPATGLNSPFGIAFDQYNEEFYVANSGKQQHHDLRSERKWKRRSPRSNQRPKYRTVFPGWDHAGHKWKHLRCKRRGRLSPSTPLAARLTLRPCERSLAAVRNWFILRSSRSIPAGTYTWQTLTPIQPISTVYPAGADGNEAPIRKIHGHLTTMRRPIGIALDSSDNIYEANGRAAGINVYAAGSNGNVAPINTIHSFTKRALIRISAVVITLAL